MFLYHVAITLLLLVVLANLLNNLRRFRGPPLRGSMPQPLPRVSVLIPARDEESNIGRCIDSLRRQDYPNLEILVLDDDSSDRTAAIVAGFAREDPRVRLLQGRPLPPGWHGKAFACHQLAQEARGEWLLFTDADTVHMPSSVSASLRIAWQEKADLLSYIPRLDTGSVSEKVILPLIPFFPLFLLPLGLVSHSREPLFSMAIGTFLLFRRSFYADMGGHEIVRQEICEDMTFARLVKQRGGRLLFLDGKEILSVRFYHNFREVWRGLSKSAYAAFDFFLPGLLGLLGLNLILFVGPYLLLYLGLRHGQMDWLSVGFPLLQIGLAWLARLRMARQLELDTWPCFLHPVMVTVTITMVLHSISQALFGPGTAWKGRVYSFDGDVLTHRGGKD